MASKLKRIFTNPRVLVVIVCFLLAAYFTGLPFSLGNEGVVIKSVEKGSPAYEAELRTAEGNARPEKIIAIEDKKVRDIADYANAISSLIPNDTITLETDRAFYKVTARDDNGTGVSGLGLKVANAPKSNLNLGLDLQGGARVMLKPETKLPPEDMELLLANMNRRLNLFGLSDVVVRPASDLSGDQFIIVEVAGANEDDVRQLIARQGKFEAKIANETVFAGDELTDVCRSAQCSGISPEFGCRQGGASDWLCSFYFTISLSEKAAQRQAAATAKLAVIKDYLSEPLQLYLDDELVDELQIGSELKGNPVTSVRISGSGTGTSRKDATSSAISNMKKLQTILITGSLPVKLEIVRTDSLSPILGEQFLRNALKVGLIAIMFVVVVLVVAYRKLLVAIPIMLTSLLEVFMLLGVAAVIGWAIDLASIAGIIAAVGTGVNDQIIITDEALKGRQARVLSWKEKFKSAFSVIFGAFFTLLMAMLPLLFIGAGMLRGFALTTIIGMLVGVFITRPAYAKIIEILMDKD